MLLSCPKVHAVFPQENLQMGHDPPAWVRWGEHGGIFILRVAGLKLREPAGPATSKAGLILEVEVMDTAALQEKIEGFAGHHQLRLQPPPGPPGELLEQPILAACHIPEKQLFVYCEAPELAARPSLTGNLELQVTGAFRTRRVLCHEGDMVIHLTAAAMGRLLSYFFALARKGTGGRE
ncbi:MAG: hypothetical protein FJ134_10860 [Deltaproteobacteria bacterium]|nr:hypothetical protein [Deltaproteobacteria bacterium]